MRNLYPMQQLAEHYAAHGVAIFPCRESTSERGNVKAPIIHGGFKSATNDLAKIREWWTLYPNALVGLPCQTNSLIVIDPDCHGDVDGVKAFTQLANANSFNMQSVPLVTTPNNGLHLIFNRPPDLGKTIGKLGPSIDVKDNGYVIAAGSILADGRRYQLQSCSLDSYADWISERMLPPLPYWLVDMISKPIKENNPYPTNNTKNCSEFGLTRIEGLARKVALAPEGERNRILFWAACRVGEMNWNGVIALNNAISLLIEAGLYCGLDQHEIEKSIQSGLTSSAKSV